MAEQKYKYGLNSDKMRVNLSISIPDEDGF